MNFYRQLGELVFGTRLKRISDKFLSDVAKVYKAQDIEFEPSWFPFFYILDDQKKTTLRYIADQLEISHSAVSQLVTALEKRGLVKVETDPSDKRQRLVCFTAKGFELLEKVRPVWQAIDEGMKSLMQKGAHSKALLPALDELEDQIAQQGIFRTVISQLDERESTGK